jgi:ureidoglycolate hydrolase
MSQVIEIKVEALTDEAFAPFGQLIGPREGTPAFGGEGLLGRHNAHTEPRDLHRVAQYFNGLARNARGRNRR